MEAEILVESQYTNDSQIITECGEDLEESTPQLDSIDHANIPIIL